MVIHSVTLLAGGGMLETFWRTAQPLTNATKTISARLAVQPVGANWSLKSRERIATRPNLQVAAIGKYMKFQPLLILAAALSLVACDSKQEKERKDALENRADTLEDQAKVTKKAADANADATKKGADAQADALKKEADRTRDQK